MSALNRLAGSLRADRRAWVSAVIAAAIGLAYALMVFGWAGVAGSAPFWSWPAGNFGSTLDIRNSLSGYWWFVQDDWRWPLLSLPRAEWPTGTNAELFDIVPGLAILGKVLRSAFGVAVNPYPAWVAFCFAMNGAALALLVRTLGQRSAVAAILAGAFGALAPVVQFRFGHTALLAHWLPLSCLALYFWSRPRGLDIWSVAGLVGICLLASLTHLYLYVMTAAVAAAAAMQAALDRSSAIPRAAGTLLLILLAGVLPLWAFGLLSGVGLAGIPGDFSRYSMNLLSPVWPQYSGLFAWTHLYWLTQESMEGTSGQYEGFDYLGAGGLLLIALSVPVWRHGVGRALRRHAALTLALALLTVWALSNRIWLGHALIVAYEPPRLLAQTVLSWFRSSGRMFWPVGWLLLAIGIAGATAQTRTRAGLLAATLALAMQWIDVAPFRDRFAVLVRKPPISAFGPAVADVARAVAAADFVMVVPPVFCSADWTNYDAPESVAALEVQLMAARANARMPEVYLSRHPPDCQARPALPMGLRSAVILLHGASAARIPGMDGFRCVDSPFARICTGTAGEKR
jgi:hypothetical protein